MAALPPVDASVPDSPPFEHTELSRLTWTMDYLLAVAFVVVGPLYYMLDSFSNRMVSNGGRILLLTIQLVLHFSASYLFLTNHFVYPRSRTVLLILGAWRMLLIAWTVLLLLGWLQLQRGLMGQ